MKKSAFKILLSLLLVVVTIFSLLLALVACNDNGKFSELKGQSDRTILFIGDGMGDNHIKVTEAYMDKQLFFDDFWRPGDVITSCSNEFQATDSAAAASAMATGQKYQRGELAFKDGKNIQSISEYAKSLGKGVGIVTTDTLSGATPAGFSAHVASRSDENSIIESQLCGDIDLYLGAGKSAYEGYKDRFEDKGYTFCTTFSQLSVESGKVIGAFSEVVNYDSTDETPTLVQLAQFAVDYMESKYPGGYFLMIEAAHIDKMCSKGSIDIFKMMQYLDEFDNTIKAVSAKLQGVGSYSMIVTADHECGDLQYNGEAKDQIDNSLIKKGYHTKQNVSYYVDWKLKSAKNVSLPSTIDNTDIFLMLKQLVSNK